LALVHSLSVGPLTWKPIANRLAARGHEAVVPSLLKVADADAPFWPRVVEDLAAAVGSSITDGWCWWRTATPAR
jgi:hypothetical protein